MSFRTRRSYRNLGAACLVGFSAWFVLSVYLALTGPQVRGPLVMLAVLAVVPLVMAGLSLWILLAYFRESLTIEGERITFHGVVRSKELDLSEVIEGALAHRAGGGSLVLRSPAVRLTIPFAQYEDDDRDRIIGHFRAVLHPEVQTDWNLFVYKTGFGDPRTKGTKPGPDEVLIHRKRWDRYLVPSVVATCVVGTVAWRTTGSARFLSSPLLPVGLWAVLRFSTPAEGMVVQKLSMFAKPDGGRFIVFLLVWAGLGLAGVIGLARIGPRLDHPDRVMIAAAIVWHALLLYEAVREDRRHARRDREAADLAAKARGEAPSDSWQTE